MSGLWDRLGSLLFPKRCVLCGRVVTYHELTCGDCVPVTLEGARCARCGKNPPSCGCRMLDWAFAQAAQALLYEGRSRELVLQLKEHPDERVGAYFAREMERVAHERFESLAFDFVVEVPMTRRKRAERGHNHAEVIARAVARRMMLPFAPGVLARSEDSAVQHELTWAQRFDNAFRSYSIGRAERVAGACILLVDDVFTTGATAHACAGALRDAGAREVLVLTAVGTNYDDDARQNEA